jgi:hypothetical protein
MTETVCNNDFRRNIFVIRHGNNNGQKINQKLKMIPIQQYGTCHDQVIGVSNPEFDLEIFKTRLNSSHSICLLFYMCVYCLDIIQYS